MSKKSGEMLAEIKHGIETGEDKNGIKVDGLAYTWKQLEPLYQYIQSLQNEQRNLTKRNSRQRLANQKQYELILKLQQENHELKSKLECYENGAYYSSKVDELEQEKEDYKSRCEKAIEYINCNKQKTICAYGDNEDDDFEICLWEEDIDNLSNILQNGSENDDR